MPTRFQHFFRLLLLTSTGILLCIGVVLSATYFLIRETDPLLRALEGEHLLAYVRTEKPEHISLFLRQAQALIGTPGVQKDLHLPQAPGYSAAIFLRDGALQWIVVPRLPLRAEHLRSSDTTFLQWVLERTNETRFDVRPSLFPVPKAMKSLWISPDVWKQLPTSPLQSLITALTKDVTGIAATWGTERTIITFQGLQIQQRRLPMAHPLPLPAGECQISLASPSSLFSAITLNLHENDPLLEAGIHGVLDALWKEHVPGTVSTQAMKTLLAGPSSISVHGNILTLLGSTASPRTLDLLFDAYHSKDIPIIERRIRLSKQYTWVDLSLDPLAQEMTSQDIGAFSLTERIQTKDTLALAQYKEKDQALSPFALSTSGAVLASLLSLAPQHTQQTAPFADAHCSLGHVIRFIDATAPFLLSDLPKDVRSLLLSLPTFDLRTRTTSHGLRMLIER